MSKANGRRVAIYARYSSDLQSDSSIEDQVRLCSELANSKAWEVVDCYIDAGFCSLPWSDMWSVLMTVDPTDVEMQQVLSTGINCFGDFF